jgi:hypothetical protein
MDYYDEVFRAAAMASTKCSLGPSPHSHHQHHAGLNPDGSPHIVTMPCPHFESVFISYRRGQSRVPPFARVPLSSDPPPTS